MVLDVLHVMKTGFEGSEKKLEIEFSGNGDLRSISREVWDDILAQAHCCIISELKNSFLDSYILSESSLFVYPRKIMLKTCGTTGLLHCISGILSASNAIGLTVLFFQYSRTMFKFPSEQPYPHKDFTSETDYLNQFFDGSAYVLGPLAGPRWHIYVTDLKGIVNHSNDQSLEIVMFDLPRDKMNMFYQDLVASTSNYADSSTSNFGSKSLGEFVSKLTGISDILKDGDLDSFLFDPCGYSCNCLIGSSYFTIHITPEPNCCFVSFDTNLNLSSYEGIISKVLNVFQPSSFATCLIADDSAPVKRTSNEMFFTLPQHYSKDCAFHQFKDDFSAAFGSYESFSFEKDTILAPVSRRLSALRPTCPNSFVKADNISECLGDVLQSSNNPISYLLVDENRIMRNFESLKSKSPLFFPFCDTSLYFDERAIRSLYRNGCNFSCSSIKGVQRLADQDIGMGSVIWHQVSKSLCDLRTARDFGVGHIVVNETKDIELLVEIGSTNKIILQICPISESYIPDVSNLSGMSSSLFIGIPLSQLRSCLELLLENGCPVDGIAIDKACLSFVSIDYLISITSEFMHMISSVTTNNLDLIYLFSSASHVSESDEIRLSVMNAFPKTIIFDSASEELLYQSHSLATQVISVSKAIWNGKLTAVYVLAEVVESFIGCSCPTTVNNNISLLKATSAGESETCLLLSVSSKKTHFVQALLPVLEKGDWIYFQEIESHLLLENICSNAARDSLKVRYVVCSQ